MEDKQLVYINKEDDKGSDALFWAAYLVDDDSDVAPQVLEEASTNKDGEDEPINPD